VQESDKFFFFHVSSLVNHYSLYVRLQPLLILFLASEWFQPNEDSVSIPFDEYAGLIAPVILQRF
jgi:hypothetical protein